MKIQYDIPIPPHKGAGRPRVFDFDKMLVGGSATINSSYNSIYGCIKRFTDRPEFAEWKFELKKLDDKKVRVWRVK
jgi:hypothetical protein